MKSYRDPRGWLAVAAMLSGVGVPVALATRSSSDALAPVHAVSTTNSSASHAQTPDTLRVASTILDSDELLLMLLPEQDIRTRLLSVSNFALDPHVSHSSDKAKLVSHVYRRGNSELPLSLGANIVFASPYSDAHAQALWKRVGTPVVALEPATSLNAVRSNLQTCATILGAQRRAGAWLRWMDQAVMTLAQATQNMPRVRVLVVQSGYVVGTGTLMDEVLSLAGMANHARELGIAGHAPSSLLTLAKNPPDVLATIDLRADEKRRDLAPSARQAAIDALQIRTISLTPKHALSTSPHVLESAAELVRKVHGVRLRLPVPDTNAQDRLSGE